MVHTHSSTKKRSFTHSSDAERGEFSAYLKMGLTLSEIALRMVRDKSSLSRERKRGSVQQLDTNRKPYSAYFPVVGARVYRENRQNCGAPSVVMKAWEFLRFAEKKILNSKWSPDAIVGFAKRLPEWQDHYIPCTKTIYNLIEAGALNVINMDLALIATFYKKEAPTRKQTGTRSKY